MMKEDKQFLKAEDLISVETVYQKTYSVERVEITRMVEEFSHKSLWGNSIYTEVEKKHIQYKLTCENPTEINGRSSYMGLSTFTNKNSTHNYEKYEINLNQGHYESLSPTEINGHFKRKGDVTFLYPVAIFKLTDDRIVNKFFKTDKDMDHFIEYVCDRTGTNFIKF